MEKYNFNAGWSFIKRGGLEQQEVTLPHDAMLHENRNSESKSGSAGAYFEGGVYVYTKEFEVPIEWEAKHAVFQFEGIYQHAEIFINDQKAGVAHYGYGMTDINADVYLKYGVKNKIQVVAYNQDLPNSRWYSGAGMYRPVWLYVMESCHIDLHGIQIRSVSAEPAQVEVKVKHQGGSVKVSIQDRGDVIASANGDCVTLSVENPSVWCDENPYLYQCLVELENDGIITDKQTVSFGIRNISWSSKGLYINGKETLLRGGCIHHDNGLLGACTFEEAEWRRVRIMKENGFNAIRSSHNPCSAYMLEACDALGMYVLDETWDMWHHHKSKHDYADKFREYYKDDIKSMVEKDYNHPSVIMYSIGNEVSEPASVEGRLLEQEMVDLIHHLDDTRAVTGGFNLMILANAAKGQQMYNEEGGLNQNTSAAGMTQMNSTVFNMMTQQIGSNMNNSVNSDEADQAISPALDILDIAGYNYATGRYPLEGEKHPNRVIFGSETFPHDINHNWEMVKEYPYLIGDFMWTAWDHIGEAGLGAWSCSQDALSFDKPYPWLLSGAGVIDILGDPDGQALYAKVVWEKNTLPEMAVRPVNCLDENTIKAAWRGTNAIPSWSWRGCEGMQAHVEVYGKGAEAALLLNGIVLERKKIEHHKCEFITQYQPGVLEAIVYDGNGAETGRNQLKSATGALHIEILPESEAAEGRLLYIDVNICGENGVVERNADSHMKLTVEGGELLAYGSANPRTAESYLDGHFTSYMGRSQAIIRVGNTDELAINVIGENETACLKLPVRNEVKMVSL